MACWMSQSTADQKLTLQGLCHTVCTTVSQQSTLSSNWIQLEVTDIHRLLKFNSTLGPSLITISQNVNRVSTQVHRCSLYLCVLRSFNVLKSDSSWTL